MNAIARWGLIVVTVVGLAIDAYVHLKIAHNYRFNKTSTISEESLFRIEAVLAIAAALLVIVWRSRWSVAFALAVAGGGLILLVLYRYVDVGKVGPIPSMYEPTWNIDDKKLAVAGEAIAVVGSLSLLVYSLVTPGRRAIA